MEIYPGYGSKQEMDRQNLSISTLMQVEKKTINKSGNYDCELSKNGFKKPDEAQRLFCN